MSWWQTIYYSPWQRYAADSLSSQPRACESWEIFGGGRLVGEVVESPLNSLVLERASGDVRLSVIVLLLLVVSCYVVYVYGSFMKWNFKNMLSLSGTSLMFSASSREQTRFLRIGGALSMMSISAVVALYFSSMVDMFLLFGCCLVFCCVLRLWELGLQTIFSAFDYKPNRWRDIRNVNRFDSAILSVVMALCVVLFLPIKSLFAVVVILLAICYLYHILRIVMYFKQLRFSFLQSFLYLCAIEIVPIALLWGVVTQTKVL